MHCLARDRVAVQQITGGDTGERGENSSDPMLVSRSRRGATFVECASVQPFGSVADLHHGVQLVNIRYNVVHYPLVSAQVRSC